jgi:hypothetical protein
MRLPLVRPSSRTTAMSTLIGRGVSLVAPAAIAHIALSTIQPVLDRSWRSPTRQTRGRVVVPGIRITPAAHGRTNSQVGCFSTFRHTV